MTVRDSEAVAPVTAAPLLVRIMRQGGANMAMRAATLGLRFGLSFYIVSMLGLQAAGIYGLAIGATAIVPSAIGWGINYLVSREVVGHTPSSAAALVRDRLIITFTSLAAGTAIVLPIVAWLAGGIDATLLLIVLLAWFETLALDLYMAMIGLELALLANLLVFIRSALWVPFVMLAAWAFPAVRSIDAVFGAWIAGHLLALLVLALYLRRWPLRDGLAERRRPLAILGRARRAWFIYFSDLGIVGLGYADRFVLNALLGLAATGIYSFYFSITNALQTLIATAVVQLAMPRMVRAFRSGDIAAWRRELRREMLRTVAFSVAFGLGIFVLTEAIFRLFPGRFPVDRTLLAIMLVAAVVRSASDLLNVALTSAGRDRAYALGNVLGMLIALGSGAGFMWVFGLIGAGVSALTTASILLAGRYLYLRAVVSSGTGEAPTISSRWRA